MLAFGIDMGTTTISVVVIDGDTGELVDQATIFHKANKKPHLPFQRIQDPEKLRGMTVQAVRELIRKYGKPGSIGMTGQMHGILYVDHEGEAVSPLYTWQDGSGNELMRDGRTYAQVLQDATGSAAAGYGITTHFYLQKHGLIPNAAKKLVTLSDYIAMKLCGIKEPFIAKDMAASWGCYDLELGEFCMQELEEAGVDISFLPAILPGHSVIGVTSGSLPGGIPVTASLGDNQASVLGAVQDLSNTVLLNIGTGSQVSVGTSRYMESHGAIELRPCTEKMYLMVGSGLCGGRAYAMLEQFYREVAGMCGVSFQHTDGKVRNLYDRMETQARDFMDTFGKEAAWKIRTTFSGTRSNPAERGNISGIGIENFHPGAMTVGMLQGVLDELYQMYEKMCAMTGSSAMYLVGSGNGIRQNRLLQELAQELFRMPLKIPQCSEEAAYGAAIQSLASAGFAGSVEEMQQKIRYRSIYE